MLAPVTANRCWPVTGGTVQIPLNDLGPRVEGTVIRLGYSARYATKITLWMADRPTDIELRPGIGKIFLPAVAGADRVTVLDLPAGVCLGDITPGRAVPRP